MFIGGSMDRIQEVKQRIDDLLKTTEPEYLKYHILDLYYEGRSDGIKLLAERIKNETTNN